MKIIGKNIDLRKAEVNDAKFVLSLRLDSELNKYLSIVEDNLDKQKDWIKQSSLNDQEWYFIVQNKKEEPVGTIRIYNVKEEQFCWGSWIIIPDARKYATFESIFLLYKFAFQDLAFKTTYFDVRKKNEKALNFYLRFGAKITNEDKQDFFMSFSQEDFFSKEQEFAETIDNIYNRNRNANNPN